MKKIVLTVIVALFSTSFVSQSLASGSGDNSKTIKIFPSNAVKPGHYTLVYASEHEGRVRVDIFDQKGKHLKYDMVENTSGFKRSYDLSSLPKGKYYFRIKDQNNVYRTTINHLLVENDLKVSISPLEKEGKYKLEVIHNSTNPVWVNIYNNNHQVIFSDKIDVDHNFSRVYDLKNVYDNAKTIEVYSDGKTIKQYLN